MHYIPESDILSDKIILVTGASKGIGRSIAIAYAKQGATVILLARNVKALSEVYDIIVQEKHPTPAIYPFNLATANADDFSELATTIKKNFGKLDGLLLNAGILPSLTPIEQYPIEQWYQVMQLNLNSKFLLCQSLIPIMQHSQSPSVVFTVSNQIKTSCAYWGAYAIADNGTLSLMQILYQEFTNRKLRFNAINPGKVDTSLRDKIYPGGSKDKVFSPEELHPLYIHLMSENSSSINGQILRATELL
jgi:NAD(P)-dependent dehydrogenase (short-subunit alcohol dehydrogenase family)